MVREDLPMPQCYWKREYWKRSYWTHRNLVVPDQFFENPPYG